MLAEAALSCALGFAVLYPLARAGGMGLGDVKLLAAVGALTGLARWSAAAVDAILVGGAVAVVVAAAHGRLAETLRRAFALPAQLWRGRTRRAPRRPRPGETIPFGVAIGAGALLAWWSGWPW